MSVLIITVLLFFGCVKCSSIQASPHQRETPGQIAEVILGPSKPSGKLEHDPVSSVSICDLLSLTPRDEGFPPERDLCDVYTYGSASPTHVMGSLALAVPLTVTQHCATCQSTVSLFGRWHCPDNNTKLQILVDGQPAKNLYLSRGRKANSLIFTTEINATSSLGLVIPEPFNGGLHCISELSLLWGDDSGITSGFTVAPFIPPEEQLEKIKQSTSNRLDVIQDNIQVRRTSNDRPSVNMKKTTYDIKCTSSGDSINCKWTKNSLLNEVELEPLPPMFQGNVGAAYTIKLKSIKMGQRHVLVKVCQEGSLDPEREHACSFLIDLHQGNRIIGRAGGCSGLSFETQQRGIYLHQKRRGHPNIEKLHIEAVGNGIEDVVLLELPPIRNPRPIN
ncbi:hypothetical protein [Saguinine gammaherpesvirus 1]|uniref:Uncharacterized protein n=1 Tax=Saguinine gammaherpesvirus 1 TaxID=2169901 RepID=A0A9Q8QUT8_9GAMA|nr:hypothetical protein [Saguinine gammaherpesvirus 1]